MSNAGERPFRDWARETIQHAMTLRLLGQVVGPGMLENKSAAVESELWAIASQGGGSLDERVVRFCQRVFEWVENHRKQDQKIPNPLDKPLQVRTFFVVEGAYWDPHTDFATLNGVVPYIAINPDTGTNDRYEVAVELDRSLSIETYFEFRLVRLDEQQTEVYRAGWAFDPKKQEHPTTRWLFFTFPSLKPDAWQVGQKHAIELWDKDRRLAYRELDCVPIEDA